MLLAALACVLAVGAGPGPPDADPLDPPVAAAPEASAPGSPYSPVAPHDGGWLSDLPELVADFAPPIDEAFFEEVTLVFTGDNLLGARMPRLIAEHGAAWPYDAVADVLSGADVTFGNLECPITDYGVKTPGKSWESIQERRNFIFKAPPDISGGILSAAGFDVVSLANNHAMDYCATGMTDTLAALAAAGITPVGGGTDIAEAFAPVVINRKGVRIGFIARSKIVPPASKAGTDTPGLAWHGAAYSEELSTAIRGLKARVDIVVVTFHWGYESQRRHAAYQQEIAYRAIDDGADLIIGHHPHVLQGIEHYNGGVIAYSLGNFLFTGASPVIESAVLKVTAGRDGVRSVELLPCWVRGGKPEPAWDDKLLKRIQGICDPCGTALDGTEGWLTVQPAAD